MIANKFTSSPIRLAGDKSKRQLIRQFHQLPLTGTLSFTPADTKEVIQLAKSTTDIRPEGMSTLYLKNFAQGAINYLTNIFNLSITTGHIHEIWQKAINQKHRQGLAPISLLCPAAKTLAAKNTDTHPCPSCSTWLSAETLDMHCTVDGHRRHCGRLIKKKQVY